MTAGTITLGSSVEDIFNCTTGGIDFGKGGPCTTYILTNNDATNTAYICVDGLHYVDGNGNPVDYFPLAPGQTIPFRSGLNGISRIRGYAQAGTPAVSGGIESRI
jgi:hypothetical protein